MCSLVHSQNKGLSKYQRRASRLHIDLSPVQRQRDRQATARARRHMAGNLGPRDGIFQQTVSRLLVPNHVFLGS